MNSMIIKINIKEIIKVWIALMSSIFTAITVLLSFVTWEDIGVAKWEDKMAVLVGIGTFLFIAACGFVCFFRKKNIIWERGKAKIQVCYNDIIYIAFPNKRVTNRLVVIPVNTCFDTIVDENIAIQSKPLIAPNTVHGQWIKKMVMYGKSLEQIDAMIVQSLKSRKVYHIKELSRDEKERGHLKCYPQGTIAAIEGENGVTYLLLAVAEFDENNNAHSSKEVIIKCMQELLCFYNQNGQGYDLYLPLIGTGMSRANLKHTEALQIIKAFLQLHSEKIQGTFNIVIYSGDKEKVCIFD